MCVYCAILANCMHRLQCLLLVSFIWSMLPCTSKAQVVCGLGHLNIRERMATDRSDSLDLVLETYALQSHTRRAITIPVVVHVVYFTSQENIPDARIEEQIDILNRAFNAEIPPPAGIPDWIKQLAAPAGIRFCLATQDPDGHPSGGITRTRTDEPAIGLKTAQDGRLRLFYDELGGKTPWPTKDYLNLYVCDLGESIAGYASLPGRSLSPQEDGAVVNTRYWGRNPSPDYPNGLIACHEVGHYFNLLHPWGEGGCISDDRVRDTPQQEGPYPGCPMHPQRSCGSDDLVANFMDYTHDPCVFMFTRGQVLRMQASIALFRPDLPDTLCDSMPDGQESAVTLHPNPVGQGPLIIRWGSKVEVPAQIQVFSLDGRLVDQTKGHPSGIYSFKCEHWPPGMYVLHGQTSEKVHTFKFIKSD
jgi:hypothetical protein